MGASGVIDITRPTSIGGMNPWYFTCRLQREVVVSTKRDGEVGVASHRSDQGEEVVEKSSAERRASRTRRNGCGVPPCTMHEIRWGTNGQERLAFHDKQRTAARGWLASKDISASP